MNNNNSNNENELKTEFTPKKSSKIINKFNPKSNLPFELNNNNNKNYVNVNLTNKKYHNNYIANYNIIQY